MQVSYTKNYFKIYATQLAAIVINVLSLVIVIPYLSGNTEVYGIYSLCISFTIFFSYADLGFLNAGYKYASEYYAKNKKQKEIEIIGFVSFILTLFVLVFAIILLLLAYNPHWLIKDISGSKNIAIAKNLLLILAFFSPTMILQRMLQVVYGIRVQDYILQTIIIIINACKIGSVYFFITENDYNITGYFLVCQLFTSIGLVFGLLYAKKKYSISLRAFFLNIKFSKEIFKSIKGLAFGTLYVTIAWILFYELDPYAIARLSGSEAVAFYSIGLTCLAFFRSIFGTLFGPFTARFNHFLAMTDYDGLINLVKTVICILLPAVVFPTLSLALLSKPFVFTWVGDKFSESVKIVSLLSLCNLLGFISYPSGILVVATKRIRLLYIISSVQVIVYWGGISIFFLPKGFMVFAWFELICFTITGIIHTIFICTFLRMRFFEFIKRIILPACMPVVILLLMLFTLRNFLPVEKNKLYLLEVVVTGIIAVGIATIVYYFTSPVFNNYVNKLLPKLKHPFISLTHKKKNYL